MTPSQASTAERGWALMSEGKSLAEAAVIVGETAAALDRQIWEWRSRPYRPVRAPRPAPQPCSEETRSIIRRVAGVYDLTVADVLGDDLTRTMAWVRQAAIHAVKTERPKLSNSAIGRIFGCRHPTTVLHALRAHEARLAWGAFLIWAASVEQPDLFARAA